MRYPDPDPYAVLFKYAELFPEGDDFSGNARGYIEKIGLFQEDIGIPEPLGKCFQNTLDRVEAVGEKVEKILAPQAQQLALSQRCNGCRSASPVDE